jgi:hypothetical protein
MAPDKKTPLGVAPISCSSMRVGSCSSPTSDGRGRRADRRHTCATATATIACRSAVVWPSRHDGGAWRSIFGVSRATSRALTSAPSSSICFATCAGPSTYSGIAARSIDVARFVRFLADHPRLRVHYFPAYAPELNPAEYVWTQTDHELSNGVPDDLRELRARLADATRRLRRSKTLLWSCIYASDLPWGR